MRSRSTPSICLLFALAACGGAAGEGSGPASPAVASAPAGPHKVVVFATASLRRPFEQLARRYEQDHPGAVVELRCEGGSKLLDAMNAGERCDVVAIGDSSLMSKFTAAGLLAPGSPAELARNHVAIAVAKGNQKQVRGLADLKREDLRIALGKRSSSIGRHARWVLSHVPADPVPAAEADSADGVLALVAEGAADAGIVYVTSFAAAPASVEMVAIPGPENTPVLYSISATREAPEPKGAAAFRALALGTPGQAILHEHGFLPIGTKQ